jgi:hypothetical protein
MRRIMAAVAVSGAFMAGVAARNASAGDELTEGWRADAALASVPVEVAVAPRPWRLAAPPYHMGGGGAAPVLVGGADPARGATEGGGDADLAKKLTNPIADLISIPLQFNYDRGYGTGDDGYVAKVNIQPVIPISLNCNWNVVSRTILPVTGMGDTFPGDDGTFGLGDTLQSLFLSPKAPTSRGLIWGAGPVFLLPTATDARLGGEKWGAGPTVVGLVQKSGWTAGLLANHIWSFAGADDRHDVNATFLQPFLSYTTPTAWTFTLNTESTYDWEAKEWSVPVNAIVSKIVKIGHLPVSIGAGIRYWAEAPEGGPGDLGLRLQFTFLLPKR